MMKPSINKFLFSATLLSLSAVAVAQTSNVGYVTDSRGAVAKSGTGLCWRTSSWTPAMATSECDPDLAKKEADGKAMKPAVVAKPPAAAAAKPVVPVSNKVSLKADTLFDFNKATLRDAGKATLDDVLRDVKKFNLEVIIAVGYADRFGTDAYNQKLSEKRANAVKAYLVSKGLEPNRVYTEGKGEKNPLTVSSQFGDQCPGQKKTKALIECLQPDRRVEMEIIGTKFPDKK